MISVGLRKQVFALPTTWPAIANPCEQAKARRTSTVANSSKALPRLSKDWKALSNNKGAGYKNTFSGSNFPITIDIPLHIVNYGIGDHPPIPPPPTRVGGR